MKQVDDGERKASENESLEDQVIDEVNTSNETHAPLPVDCTTIKVSTHIIYNQSCRLTLGNTLLHMLFLLLTCITINGNFNTQETDIGTGLDSKEAKVENMHPEEITAGRIKVETMDEDFEEEKGQEEESVSILETEDAKEEASFNPTSQQQSNPEQENAQKEAAAVRDPHDEHRGSKAALEEVCRSQHPYIEIMDVVEGNFEEDKSELTRTSREIDGTSREMEVSDSQCTESVSLG